MYTTERNLKACKASEENLVLLEDPMIFSSVLAVADRCFERDVELYCFGARCVDCFNAPCARLTYHFPF